MQWDDFGQEYEDRAYDVTSSSFRTFSQRLQDWLSHLDTTPAVAEVARALEADANFDEWYAKAEKTVRGSVGSGRLDWAADRTARLGQQLGLFRHFAREEMAFAQFSSDFFWAGNNFDQMVYKITSELFTPFARDLLKHLRRVLGPVSEKIPASDRVVQLDHNSRSYRDLTTSLAALTEAVRGSNDFPGTTGDREQILAELAAGQELLQPMQIRSNAFINVVGPMLKWIGDHMGGAAISIIVSAAAVAIAALFGVQVPGLG